MAAWMPVGDGFIEADVIRWTEPVYRDRRRGKPIRVGERLVTAEVLAADTDGWVHLLVRRSEALSPKTGWNLSDVTLPPKDTETKRRRRTIARGHAERLAWSDESARALIASRFLNEQNTTSPTMPATPRPTRQPARHSVSGAHKRRVRKPRWRPPRPRY